MSNHLFARVPSRQPDRSYAFAWRNYGVIRLSGHMIHHAPSAAQESCGKGFPLNRSAPFETMATDPSRLAGVAFLLLIRLFSALSLTRRSYSHFYSFLCHKVSLARGSDHLSLSKRTPHGKPPLLALSVRTTPYIVYVCCLDYSVRRGFFPSLVHLCEVLVGARHDHPILCIAQMQRLLAWTHNVRLRTVVVSAVDCGKWEHFMKPLPPLWSYSHDSRGSC